MNDYMPRDDKLKELICRLMMFAIYAIIAGVFSDGLTFMEGMVLWLFTGVHYDTTILLNNQRKDEYRRLHERLDGLETE